MLYSFAGIINLLKGHLRRLLHLHISLSIGIQNKVKYYFEWKRLSVCFSQIWMNGLSVEQIFHHLFLISCSTESSNKSITVKIVWAKAHHHNRLNTLYLYTLLWHIVTRRDNSQNCVILQNDCLTIFWVQFAPFHCL